MHVKRLLFFLSGTVLLYLLWLGFQGLLLHAPEASQAESLPVEIRGAYHIHSNLSDGRLSPEKIAEIAAEKGLDFIILADHGRPNRESLSSQGWNHGVLTLAGSELSVNRGHLVGLGFNPSKEKFSHDADLAAREISSRGGFSVVAHPYSKAKWSWGNEITFAGLEIMDADSMVSGRIMASLPYLPALLFHPRFALLKTMRAPSRLLEKWDYLSRNADLYAFFSTDAHFLYKALFSLFQLHIILDRPLSSGFSEARKQVMDGLKAGRFFNSVEAAAPAGGFRFQGTAGDRPISMGRSLSFRKDVMLRIETPFPFKVETRLLCGGEVVLRGEDSHFEYHPSVPGVYRVEVYLKCRTPMAGSVPWIVSNPIFLRKNQI